MCVCRVVSCARVSCACECGGAETLVLLIDDVPLYSAVDGVLRGAAQPGGQEAGEAHPPAPPARPRPQLRAQGTPPFFLHFLCFVLNPWGVGDVRLQPRYRAHAFNDAPKSPGGGGGSSGRPSAPQEHQPGESTSEAAASDDGATTTATTRQPSPYHAGILSTARLQADADADAGADAADCPRAGQSEEEEDDDGGFFLHLRQGARKMSSTPHRPEKRENQTAAVAEEEGGEVGQRPFEGEPSAADKEHKKTGEKEDEKATVERLHFGITDILHKPAPRNSIRKVMVPAPCPAAR